MLPSVSSLDEDLRKKQEAKYDLHMEAEVREWLSEITGVAVEGDLHEALKDGVVLCKLLNKISPDKPIKISASNMVFKQMENIQMFLTRIAELGVPSFESFMTIDLYEKKNMTQVVSCMYSVSRNAQKHGFVGPRLGPNLAQEHKRPPLDAAIPPVTAAPVSIEVVEAPIKEPIVTEAPIKEPIVTEAPVKSEPSVPVEREAIIEPYGLEGEDQVREWISEVSGFSVDGDFHEALKDGVVLCTLINHLMPKSTPIHMSTSKTVFKQVENIQFFVTRISELGVPAHELFKPNEFYEKKNMRVFFTCIYSVSKFAKLNGYNGPALRAVTVNEPKVVLKDGPAANSVKEKLQQIQSTPAVSEKAPIKIEAAENVSSLTKSFQTPRETTLAHKETTLPKVTSSEAKQEKPATSLDDDLRKKQEAKYDLHMEAEVREWITEITGMSVEGDFHEALKDGVILCTLIDKIMPENPIKISRSSMTFKQMENIQYFLDKVRLLGVPSFESFMTIDLYEKKNMTQVLTSFYSISRNAAKGGYDGPSLGPKLAQENKREFTEEQLREARFAVPLLAGFNKGASQAGMGAFGGRREIGGIDLGKQAEQQADQQGEHEE